MILIEIWAFKTVKKYQNVGQKWGKKETGIGFFKQHNLL